MGIAFSLIAASVFAASDQYAIQPGQFKLPVEQPLNPRDALQSFRLDEGFQIDLVAAEPLIEDPEAMSFDEHGRIYVAEMRGFTLDVNGTGEFERVGRVSLLEDLDGDGRMDRSTVFLDRLIQPRAVRAFRGGVLIAEHKELWFVKDTDGDGRGDLKELIDPEYAKVGSVEHRPNGLLLALDNWIYNSASTKRYRFHQGKWEIGRVAERGQWGISQNDYGRLFYNFNWSQLQADMVPPGYMQRNPAFESTFAINVGLVPDQKVFPIRPNTAVKRGYTPGVLDKQGKLTTFASACGPHVYRGGQFPAEYQGNAFVCGPCANIVKRNVLDYSSVALTAKSAYSDREFLAPTDERFRPVAQADGPDGSLYLVDMYRGVVQQWNYMTKYLREESNQRRLFAPVHLGRIYRVTHGKAVPPVLPGRMNTEELVAALADDNGWIRDTAQRLLIERNDTASIPLLVDGVLNMRENRGRIHALWTLAGLKFRDTKKLLPAFDDRHPQVRIAAMRVIEEELTTRDLPTRMALSKNLESMADDPDQQVQLQLVLTMANLAAQRSIPTMLNVIRENADYVVMREAIASGLETHESLLLHRLMDPQFWDAPTIGRSLMIELFANLVTNDGDGRNVRNLFQRFDRPERGFTWREKPALSGALIRAKERIQTPVSFREKPGFADRIPQIKDLSLRRSPQQLCDAIEWPGHKIGKPAGNGPALTKDEQKDFA